MRSLQFRSSRHATELEVCALRSRFQQGALDTQKNEVERVHCDSDLRSARTGHGSRSTAELAGGVPAPSASSPAPALGAPYCANGTAKITTYAYDRFDRPTVTTFPDGTVSTNVYENMDPSDYLFKSKTTIARKLTAGGSPQTTSSVSKSNILGQVKKTETITGAGAGATTLVTSTRTYDILGRMVSMQDAASNTWTYTFDSLGRTLAKNDPDAGIWTYKYDDASRLEWQKDAKNQYTTFEYDALGRPTNKKLRPTGGVSGPVTENTETTYGTTPAQFDRGQVTQVVTKNGAGTELSGKTTFGYDALGRVKTQTKYIDGTAYTVNRNFDSAGYLRGIQYPDGDVIGQYNGSGTPLGYDQAGRLTSIPGILNSVTYNALGSPLVQTNANGTTTTKTYDPNRFWLTAISTTTPSVTVQNLSYTLNEVGMALQVGSPIANEQWAYEYDSLGRLVTSTNGVPANSQSWTYNNIGNILTNVGATTNTYAYGGPRPHAVTNISGGSFGNLSFTYDANGNMETGNGRSIAWRPDNLPSSVTMTATSTTTSFTYDPFGERVKKTTGATSTVYPFGDDYEINAGVVTKYVNAGFGVMAKRVGATTYWLHTDRLGSINATTDNTGAEVLRRTYRAYGDLLGQTGTNTESRGYIDQRQDPETGMTYLHARLYDSKLGVFISPDPAGADLNAYRYATNDPVNGMDPSGLETCYIVGDTPKVGPPHWVCYPGDGTTVNVEGKYPTSSFWLTGPTFAIEGLEDLFRSRREVSDAERDGARNGPCVANDPRSRCQVLPKGGTDDPCKATPKPEGCSGTGSGSGGNGNKKDENTGQKKSIAEKVREALDKLRVCGGGGFGYLGNSFEKGPLKAETLALLSYDSQTGGSHSAVVAGGIGHWSGGFETTRVWRGWEPHAAVIGFGEQTRAVRPTQMGPFRMDQRSVGGLLQYEKGQLSIGGFVGGTNSKTTRSLGGGGYVTLSLSDCH